MMNVKTLQPTLQHFILRAQILSFYRSVNRAARHIPAPDARKETIQWIRGEIEQSRSLTDVDRIQQHLSYLRRLMKQALPGFELAASTPPTRHKRII